MRKKTIIITGANSGIGKAAAIQIAAAGHKVVLACRNPARAEAAQREIGGDSIVAQLDLSRRKSVQDFTDWAHRELDGIDVLINNAADFDLSKTRREMTPDGFERIWFTNHLAPALLVNRLMDQLVTSPQGRVINVSSKGLIAHPFLTVNLKDPMFRARPFSVSKAYYQSKLAQTMYTLWLARQLTGTMVTANCIRVTNVRLDMARFPTIPQWLKNIYALKARFSISPDDMAQTYVDCAIGKKPRDWNGKLIDHPLKEVDFPAYARDPLCVEQVAQLTHKQLGIAPAITYEAPGA